MNKQKFQPVKQQQVCEQQSRSNHSESVVKTQVHTNVHKKLVKLAVNEMIKHTTFFIHKNLHPPPERTASSHSLYETSIIVS